MWVEYVCVCACDVYTVSTRACRSQSGDTPTRRCVTPSVDRSDNADEVDSSDSGGYGSRRSSVSSQSTAYPDPRRRSTVAMAADFGPLLDASLTMVSVGGSLLRMLPAVMTGTIGNIWCCVFGEAGCMTQQVDGSRRNNSCTCCVALVNWHLVT